MSGRYNWKVLTATLAYLICERDLIDTKLMKNILDKLWDTNKFLEEFDKEANHVVLKYDTYRTKLDEFLAFNWTTEEQYAILDDKYNKFLVL